MNPTIETILSRRSIRRYEQRPVEKEKIDLILKCGQYAPSGLNLQPWHFTVVTDRKLLDKFTAETKKILVNSPVERLRVSAQSPDYDTFRGAPMAIFVSGKDDAVYAAADCANAMQNMALAAHALGLGSCYIASFKTTLSTPEGAHLIEALRIPRGYTPLYALALGYGCETLGERAPRRENTVTYITP